MLRHAAQDEQVGQDIDHVDRLQLAADPDGQALMGELVHDVEGAELAAIVGPLLDEVIGPDVIRSTRLSLTTQPASRSSALILR